MMEQHFAFFYTIKNFNEKLDRERFYVFELIFLLQNDYIFTKKQLEKDFKDMGSSTLQEQIYIKK